jgi:hypothetical protein
MNPDPTLLRAAANLHSPSTFRMLIDKLFKPKQVYRLQVFEKQELYDAAIHCFHHLDKGGVALFVDERAPCSVSHPQPVFSDNMDDCFAMIGTRLANNEFVVLALMIPSKKDRKTTTTLHEFVRVFNVTYAQSDSYSQVAHPIYAYDNAKYLEAVGYIREAMEATRAQPQQLQAA